ncbi:MAG TPA: MBL fold metallo-hydrolase [bacterium]|nr:MBL fold metallo-hydrolase [bacterium]HPQ66060.1 MBL fold metallo-hydrolase [bacterium]
MPPELPRGIVRMEAGPLAANCYLFTCPGTTATAVIDPGGDAPGIIDLIERSGLSPVAIVNTHAHVDHIAANRELVTRYGVPLAIHTRDGDALNDGVRNLSDFGFGSVESPPADRVLDDGESLEIGSCRLLVIATPGHTPGGICLYWEGGDDGPGVVFTGDTLFAGGVGRADFPGGSMSTLLASIRDRLYVLPPPTLVLPGHGPATTIGRERASNPFVRYP